MTDHLLDDPEAELNLKQVAARLGVHYMTAYRYVRQGRLAGHRVGTEWRVSAGAVAAFGLDDDSPPAVAPEPAEWAGRLEPALLDGDEPVAWAVLQRALAAGHDPAFCYLDMIAPAIGRIAERAAADGDPAAQPIATAVAYRLVARLGAGFRRPGRSRGTVVFGSPVGERHHLPLAIVADLVRLGGFDVLELGPDTEPGAFAAAARRAHRLVAVALSVTGADHIDAARAAIAAVRAVDPAIPIVVGGQAVLNPEIARVLDADAWAPDGRTAATVLAQIVGGIRHHPPPTGMSR